VLGYFSIIYRRRGDSMLVEQWLGKDNTLGIDIWNRKYRKGEETFDQWLDRVSNNNSDVRQAILDKKFIPGGRILSNRGIKNTRVTYSNCYVVTPPEDSLESIYESRTKLARTYSYGGGCGIDISKLAPAGAKVHNQAEKTSGAVSFMEGYSMTTEEIGQNGRRGALMISLDCHHPDLIDFIDIKTKEGKVTKANISVRVTDDFMRAVENDDDWVMSFTRKETGDTITKVEKARVIFDKLCENNWNWAEPGILFWDNICNYNLLSNNKDFKYAGTNPCAEEPLPAGGSCLLSSINLSAFVSEDGKFDFDDFYRVVDIGVNYLNEVLEEGLMLHPLQEQRDSVAKWRQIGLGVMGVADMLIKMHLRYDSDEAIEHCRDVSMGMANHAMYVSARIASHKGMYPGCTANIESTSFFKANADTVTRNVVERYGMANSQLLTIAPTGTISTMLGISGGIEPIFAKSYRRKTESLHGETQYYDVLTPIYKEYAEKHGLTVNDKFPEWFVDSSEINYNKRIEMQSAWQKGIDASISSTVNLPNSATIEDVKNIYFNAWKCGLKGITVYRSGCKREGVLVSEEDASKSKTVLKEEDLPRGFIVDCTEELVGKKRKLITGCGSLHVLAYFNPINGSLQEVYFNKGSTGGCANFMTGLSRMVSLLCRAGVDIISIKDQLDSTGVCPSYATRTATKHDTSRGSCCPMAIGNALVDMWNEMQSEVTDVTDYISDEHPSSDTGIVLPKPTYSKCPECGEPLAREGGCVQCKSCGWSKCE
jgi:ribonucleoside-diphosphate reductase alpha chain